MCRRDTCENPARLAGLCFECFLLTEFSAINNKLDRLLKGERRIMATVQDFQDQADAIRATLNKEDADIADVSAHFADLNQQVADLKKQIAGGGLTAEEEQAALDAVAALKDEVNAREAALAAVNAPDASTTAVETPPTDTGTVSNDTTPAETPPADTTPA